MCKEVTAGSDGLGVRIPDHWFTEIVQEAGIPFVTTSVNLAGEAPLQDPNDLDPDVAKEVDFLIDEVL